MEPRSSTTLPPLCTGLAAVPLFHSQRPVRLCCACTCVCSAELQRLVELISSCYTRLFHTVTSSAHTGVLSPPPGQSPTCPYFLFPLSCLFSCLFSILTLLSPFLPHCNPSVSLHLLILFFCISSSLLACMSLSLNFLLFFFFSSRAQVSLDPGNLQSVNGLLFVYLASLKRCR